MVGQLSGKAGSTVASRNRSGSYFRTKTIPKLVTNPFTDEVRNNFTLTSQGWRSLSQADQLTWSSWAATVNRTDSLGLGYNLTGAQGYMLINRNLFSAGLPATSTPPTGAAPDNFTLLFLTPSAEVTKDSTTVTTGAASATQTVGDTTGWAVDDILTFQPSGVTRTIASITSSTVVVLNSTITTTTGEAIDAATPPAFTLTWDPDLPANANQILLFATPPLSAGVARPGKNTFRLITTLTPSTGVTTSNEVAAYIEKFGSIPAGSKIFIQVFAVSSEGLRSGGLVASSLVS